MVASVNLDITAGDLAVFNIKIVNIFTGQPEDLTDKRVEFYTNEVDGISISKSTDDLLVITNAKQGTIKLTLLTSDTLSIVKNTNLNYKIVYHVDNDNQILVARGQLKVRFYTP